MPTTENIRRYRGDWLLEALTSIRKDLTPWTPIQLKPYWMNSDYTGRYHQPTGKWWPDAGESPSASKPAYKPVRLPPEDRINYPGELWYLTPGWKHDMETLLKLEGVWEEFRAYERNLDKIQAEVAYYHAKKHRVVWGPHSQGVRESVLILSDATPYEPLPQPVMHAST